MFGSRNFLFAKSAAGPVIISGKLFMWGDNFAGALGTGNTTYLSSPVQVGALTNWSKLATGNNTLAVKSTGELWSWGFNSTGQAGLGDTYNRSSPVQVGSLTNWATPETGINHSLCIKTDGTLWTWGRNQFGQLGLGDTANRSSPVQIGSSTNWSGVSGGMYFTLAVDNGKLFAWGKNHYGQLGTGNTTYLSSPVQVGALTNWQTPSAGGYQSLCVKTDGTLWSWGWGNSGRLGLGDTISRSSPVQIGSLTNWAIPSSGGSDGKCVKTDGTLWIWGGNAYGKLGQNNTIALSSPVQVGSLTNWSIPTSGTSFNSCVKTDGTLWTWGSNTVGQLGQNDGVNRSSPVQVGSLTTWAVPAANTATMGCIQGVGTAAPVNLTLPVVSGIAQEGEILTSTTGTWSQFPTSFTYQWQRGTSNIGGATSSTYTIQAADVGSTLRCVVTAINGIGSTPANSANTATVIAYVGYLYGWGNNIQGELGLGNKTRYDSPVQVGSLSTWKNLAGGGQGGSGSTACTRIDGTLWMWGKNTYGGLGLGNTTNRSSPVQVGALTNWLQPTLGYNNSMCTKTDGSLWAWGANTSFGALGLNDTYNRSSPVQVGALTNWSKVSITGLSFCLAIKTDGTLWSWGRNNEGQLGQNDKVYRSSPVQVGASTNWSQVSNGREQSLAITTDGKLFAWGANQYGQCGFNDVVNRSSPVQVGALTNWKQALGAGPQSLCIKTDGTLWGFGENYTGELGLGDRLRRSSPVQVGSLTDWGLLRQGNTAVTTTTCVKTDGTVWAWGSGGTGQTGQGYGAFFSSPKQIGTLTTWINTAQAQTSILAIQGTATVAPVNLTVPVISGTTTEGSTLASSTGTWSNFPSSFAFQWQRGTSNISGATSSTYVIQAADVGSTLRCVVTATNGFGSASANSANTATITLAQGQLWIWGMGSFGIGTLGQNNSTVSQSSPVQVGSASNWTYSAVSTYAALAVNSAGQLWAWGNSATYGSLGLNDLVNRSSPVQVGALTNWKKVFNDQQVTCAIKSDGTLWAWGRNTQGQLGQGDTTNRSSPVQIGSSTNWVTASVGGAFGGTSAINSLGELWTTGANSFGQLGLNDTTNRSNLTQVPGTDWKNVFAGQSTVHAIKTNGTLWGWGRANDGVIGNNSTAYVSSPVQIGSDTNWSNLRKPSNYSTAAVRTNGTIWAWGNNGSGQLGLNDTNKRSSPVQVGALTTWVRVTNAGSYGCLARKTDGTLWTWGSNNNGALGIGDTYARSSPVQIGSLTTWVINGFGGSNGANTSAIKTP